MPRSKFNEIEVMIHYSPDKTELQKKISQWFGNIYYSILEELSKGEIHSLIFHILDDDEFKTCFGRSKEELYHLKK